MRKLFMLLSLPSLVALVLAAPSAIHAAPLHVLADVPAQKKGCAAGDSELGLGLAAGTAALVARAARRRNAQ